MKLACTLTAAVLCVCAQLPALSQETHSANLDKAERDALLELCTHKWFADLHADKCQAAKASPPSASSAAQAVITVGQAKPQAIRESIKTDLVLVTYAHNEAVCDRQAADCGKDYLPPHRFVALIRPCESPANCKGSGYPFYDLAGDQVTKELTVTCDWSKDAGCNQAFLEEGGVYRVTVLSDDVIQLQPTVELNPHLTHRCTLFLASQDLEQKVALERQEQRRQAEENQKLAEQNRK